MLAPRTLTRVWPNRSASLFFPAFVFAFPLTALTAFSALFCLLPLAVAVCLYQQRLLCHHNRSAMESITSSRSSRVPQSSNSISSQQAGGWQELRRRPSCGMSVYINFVAQRGKLSSVQKNEMTNEVCRLMAAEMRAGQRGGSRGEGSTDQAVAFSRYRTHSLHFLRRGNERKLKQTSK